MSGRARRNIPKAAHATGVILPDGGRGMTLTDIQHRVADAFAVAGIADGLLEAEILLRHALQVDRAAFFAQLRRPVSQEEVVAFEQLVARRLQREPTAYITAQREFFSLAFRVTPDALIPRPETELLV